MNVLLFQFCIAAMITCLTEFLGVELITCVVQLTP